jgi:hypothetical protein
MRAVAVRSSCPTVAIPTPTAHPRRTDVPVAKNAAAKAQAKPAAQATVTIKHLAAGIGRGP